MKSVPGGGGAVTKYDDLGVVAWILFGVSSIHADKGAAKILRRSYKYCPYCTYYFRRRGSLLHMQLAMIYTADLMNGSVPTASGHPSLEI